MAKFVSKNGPHLKLSVGKCALKTFDWKDEKEITFGRRKDNIIQAINVKISGYHCVVKRNDDL